MLFHIKTYQCSRNGNIPIPNCFICQGHKSHVSRREKHCMQVINAQRSCCCSSYVEISLGKRLAFGQFRYEKKNIYGFAFEYYIRCEKLTSLLQLLIKMKHLVAAAYDLISSIVYVRASAITAITGHFHEKQ